MKNPIAATVNCPQGQKLPANWQRTLEATGGTYDRRELSEMWKNAPTTKISVENLAQNARLKQPTWSQLFGNQ
jgi:hypothetical protein